MNQAFKECLNKRKLIPFPRAKKLSQKELGAAEEDLAEATDRFANGRYKYAAINAYYAFFHAARALLYSEGYRERSHYCLGITLEALFVEQGHLAGRYVRMLQGTMALREDADYSGTYSKDGASTSIANAQEFIMAARKLMQPRP
jgi:uncharacterized protein (UPF0332 family)